MAKVYTFENPDGEVVASSADQLRENRRQANLAANLQMKLRQGDRDILMEQIRSNERIQGQFGNRADLQRDLVESQVLAELEKAGIMTKSNENVANIGAQASLGTAKIGADAGVEAARIGAGPQQTLADIEQKRFDIFSGPEAEQAGIKTDILKQVRGSMAGGDGAFTTDDLRDIGLGVMGVPDKRSERERMSRAKQGNEVATQRLVESGLVTNEDLQEALAMNGGNQTAALQELRQTADARAQAALADYVQRAQSMITEDSGLLGFDPTSAADLGVEGQMLMRQLDQLKGDGMAKKELLRLLTPTMNQAFGENDVGGDVTADQTRKLLWLLGLQ